MRKKVAFFLPNLNAGGVSKVVVNLLNDLSYSKEIEFLMILNKKEGAFQNQLNPNIRVSELGTNRIRYSIFSLVNFLRLEKPDILISSITHLNIISLIAGQVLKKKPKVIIIEHGNLREGLKNFNKSKKKIHSILIKIFFPKATKIISVSKGVEQTLLQYIKINKNKLEVIFNPIISNQIYNRAKEDVDHKWFTPKKLPIILSIGRLSKEKDYESLIRAFSVVRNKIDAKLIILGEGEERINLEKLINALGLMECVDLVGFEENPYKYLNKVDLFVLSSKTEGLPTVLVEALALGCNIVSTDCPSGPKEILKGGLYGELVPVGNIEKLAEGIIEKLRNPNYSISGNEELEIWLQEFEVEQVVKKYLRLIKEAM